jgi:hypothetical protein
MHVLKKAAPAGGKPEKPIPAGAKRGKRETPVGASTKPSSELQRTAVDHNGHPPDPLVNPTGPDLEQTVCAALWMLRGKIPDFTVLIPDAELAKFKETLTYWGQDAKLITQRVPTGQKGGVVSRRATATHAAVHFENPIIPILPHSTILKMVYRKTGDNITPGTPNSGPELWETKQLEEAMNLVDVLATAGTIIAGERVYTSSEGIQMVRVMMVLRNHIRGGM